MRISEFDIYLFGEGTHYRSYQFLGAQYINDESKAGTRFTVWAPNAKQVSVVGNFNSWQGEQHRMQSVGLSGIWTLFIPGVEPGMNYKYEIHTLQGKVQLKADPYAFRSELRPQSASIVYELEGYEWQDKDWCSYRQDKNWYSEPMLIYEVHLGSWQRHENADFFTYREMAESLVEYVADMGYTHIEILPITEHPLDKSWGYQVTGYYAVTSRFGEPKDFMYFVDRCHQRGLGVIMDWVPGHFCKDIQGLHTFDGTFTYEYQDQVRRENNEWGTANFDLGKHQVQSFLISNALFWFDIYHLDGLRVDAVASMLYLDYGRREGEWQPNIYGGKENLQAIDFFHKLNKAVFQYYPYAIMAAEESTTWPLVTKPVYAGGLGFNFKWNMGWMNDMLKYMSMDPIYRSYWHKLVTFSFFYAFSENFILSISHDEVVHEKKALLDKMPGDYWSKFANLRVFLGYMMAHPGKKLLFMGTELGHFQEWSEQKSLDWMLLSFDMHKKFQSYVRELNHYYIKHGCLWQQDHEWKGFEWIDPNDYSQSVISFMRKGTNPDDFLIVVCNFTAVPRNGYRVGVPILGVYNETFNSDDVKYGGSGNLNSVLVAEKQPWHNQSYSVVIKVPPLGIIFVQPAPEGTPG